MFIVQATGLTFADEAKSQPTEWSNAKCYIQEGSYLAVKYRKRMEKLSSYKTL
jgi:hypothetical protein